MPSITCYSGEVVLLDEKDYEKAKDKQWFALRRTGATRIYIFHRPRGTDQTKSLVQTMLGDIRPYTLQFRDGNDLNYTRDNIYLTKAKGWKKGQSQTLTLLDSYIPTHCPFGPCVLYSIPTLTEIAFREGCEDCQCKDEYEPFYWKCLSYAADKQWESWRRVAK